MTVEGCKPFLNDMLIARWHEWATKKIQTQWMDTGAYNSPRSSDDNSENFSSPAQILTYDTQEFIFRTVTTATSLVYNTALLAWFSTALYKASGALPVQIGEHQFNVPGYMLIVSLLYSGAGTWLVSKFGARESGLWGKKFSDLDSYRTAVAHVHDNSESIAMSGGAAAEKDVLTTRFNQIIKSSMDLLRNRSRMNSFYTAFGATADILPMVALAPKLLGKTLDLAGARLATGAFTYMDRALSWFVYSWSEFSAFKSATVRVANFARAIDQSTGKKKNSSILIQDFTDAHYPTRVEIRNLTVAKPGDQTLVEPFTITLKPGDHMVISGKEGSGKTTLFRALSGIWPHGAGGVAVFSPDRPMCMPQETHMPLLSLRGIICYPRDPKDFSDTQVRQALSNAGMDEFSGDLDNTEVKGKDWDKRLSGGQKQCIGFARLFLHEPKVVMLDEVTSKLSPETEARLYRKLVETLSDSIIISIAHREAVARYHNIHGRLENKRLDVRRIQRSAESVPMVESAASLMACDPQASTLSFEL